jgi:hypothetical protein
MKQRFGGVLCLSLGGVLITGGSFGLDAGAGTPPPSCGAPSAGVVVPACPTGVLSLSESTTGPGTPPVGGWLVDITSPNCAFPSTSATTLTVAVPDNGTVSSPALYQNQNGPETTVCTYAVAQQAVSGFSTTYDPAGPYELPQTNDNNAVTNVGVMNAGAVVATPSPTPIVSSSPTPAPSASASPAPTAVVAGEGGGQGTGAQLPMNGSHSQEEIAAGVGLCLLGAFLLFAGRRPESDQP